MKDMLKEFKSAMAWMFLNWGLCTMPDDEEGKVDLAFCLKKIIKNQHLRGL